METDNTIAIEVAYALPEHQVILALNVAEGTTLEEAIRSSGILEQFPDIDLAKSKTGIFGKLAKGDTVLREKDRVEIYRPLIADPKDSRRKRAEKKEKVASED
ncbi:RnfH family protein [Kaarinaea lacus]